MRRLEAVWDKSCQQPPSHSVSGAEHSKDVEPGLAKEENSSRETLWETVTILLVPRNLLNP